MKNMENMNFVNSLLSARVEPLQMNDGSDEIEDTLLTTEDEYVVFGFNNEHTPPRPSIETL